MSLLKIIDTNVRSAEENMRIDRELLETLQEPTLHLYDWEKPSFTHGIFIDVDAYMNVEKLKQHGIDFAKRPTGGGIVFHIWDLAFSFLMPSSHPLFSLDTLENYRFVNEAALSAVAALLSVQEFSIYEEESNQKKVPFCMAAPTEYDVVFSGKKGIGAAQRRKKQGYLHQGTISLTLPDFGMLEEVIRSKEVVESMRKTTFSPVDKKDFPEAKRALSQLLKEKLMEKLGASQLHSSP